MKTIYIKINVAILFTLLLMSKVYSQEHILYHMDKLQQSIGENPAYQSGCKFYLGFLTDINLNVVSDGFAFSDVVKKGGTPSDPTATGYLDFDNLEKVLTNVNNVNLDFRYTPLSLGFWVKDLYFTLDWTLVNSSRLSYPKGLLQSIKGNAEFQGEDNPLTFSGIGVNTTVYNQFSLGASKKIMPGLVVGAKVKWLWGAADMSTKKSNINIYTLDGGEILRAKSDIELSTSFPVEYIEKNGLYEPQLPKFETWNNSDYTKAFVLNNNRGWAFDLGATYKVFDDLTVSASVIDLGFINWKTNSVTLSNNISYDFLPYDLNNENFTQQLTDTLTSFGKVKKSDASYKTYLNTKIFLGVKYELTKMINFGIVTRTLFYDKKAHQSLSLSCNTNLLRGLMMSFSYTLMNRSYNNFGFGFAGKLGPAQLYLLFDNYGVAINPKTVKNVAVHLGINWLFGCRQKVDYGLID